MPDITNNQVQIFTACPKLAGQEVEHLVTFPIEQSIANLPDLEEVRSISRFGLSVITVVFKDGVAISIVTPHEFRTLQRIEKTIGAKLESKVVPNISTVKQKKIDELRQSILDQEVKDYAIAIVEELKEEFDISTIAFKLASIIASKTYVKGNNNIGKSESDISRLIENMSKSSDRGDDRIGKGVYVYKLTVKSVTTGKSAEKYEKLVIL